MCFCVCLFFYNCHISIREQVWTQMGTNGGSNIGVWEGHWRSKLLVSMMNIIWELYWL